eukprot:9410365-Karenia_brevis.AAC.1
MGRNGNGSGLEVVREDVQTLTEYNQPGHYDHVKDKQQEPIRIVSTHIIIIIIVIITIIIIIIIIIVIVVIIIIIIVI